MQGTFVEHVVRFSNAVFSNNQALSAGAFYAEGSRSRVELDGNVSFIENTATGGGLELGGGAVTLSEVGETFIRGARFVSNRAIQLPGAAISAEVGMAG